MGKLLKIGNYHFLFLHWKCVCVCVYVCPSKFYRKGNIAVPFKVELDSKHSKNLLFPLSPWLSISEVCFDKNRILKSLNNPPLKGFKIFLKDIVKCWRFVCLYLNFAVFSVIYLFLCLYLSLSKYLNIYVFKVIYPIWPIYIILIV